MGLPYSCVSFSLSEDPTISGLMDLISRMNDHIVRPTLIQVAVVRGGGREQVIDPLNLAAEYEYQGSELLPVEVLSENPEYTTFRNEVWDGGVWRRKKESVENLFQSFAPIAARENVWTQLRFWGPTKIVVPVGQETREIWAARELHKSSMGWDHIVNVSVHYDPQDKWPVFLGYTFRTHACSPISSFWDPSQEEWIEKNSFEKETALRCAESLSRGFASCLQGFELEFWEYANPNVINLLGELPTLLTKELQMEPASTR